MQNSSKKPKSDIFRLSVTLCLIAGITAGLIAFVNGITATEIEKRSELKTTQSLKAVLPDADSFEECAVPYASVVSSDGKEVAVDNVWKAKKDGEYVGVSVKVSPKGYGGAVETIVGINADGEITDTRIVSMSETSGIGTKISADEFLSQFPGKSGSVNGVKSGAGKDEIQTVSGATKSSKAFLRGVNAALEVARKVTEGEEK